MVAGIIAMNVSGGAPYTAEMPCVNPKVVNSMLEATSVVRLIGNVKPPCVEPPAAPHGKGVQPARREAQEPAARAAKKRLPGSALLIKMAKDRQRQKERQRAERADDYESTVDVEAAVDGIIADLINA